MSQSMSRIAVLAAVCESQRAAAIISCPPAISAGARGSWSPADRLRLNGLR
jgi:hypothetical protein